MSSNLSSLKENIDLNIDLSPDALLVAHAETGRIVDVNSSAGDLFNCDEEDLIGKNQWNLHPSENIELYREAFKRGTKGKRVDRLKNGEPIFIITGDDDRVPVEINVKMVESNGEKFVIGSFRDATGHIRRESELESTKDQLRTLIDALPMPVTIYDSNGDIMIWSEKCASTLGYPSEVTVGESCSFFADSEEYEDLIARSLNGQSFDGYQTSVIGSSGQKIPVELYTEPIYENGELDSLIAVSLDISERESKGRDN